VGVDVVIDRVLGPNPPQINPPLLTEKRRGSTLITQDISVCAFGVFGLGVGALGVGALDEP
jgi:hypothetical protein